MKSPDIQGHNDRVRDIFDSISTRYDASNLVISLGLERIWRRSFQRHIPGNCRKVLDVCCGTGTSTRQIWQNGMREVHGVDFSPNMIETARKKYRRDKGMYFYVMDVVHTGFAGESFDCVTVVFGIRNILERKKALKEFYRVTRTGGSIMIMEFSPMDKGLLGRLSGFYLNRILPLSGGMLTGNRPAYHYLARSIRGFPSPSEFMRLMEESGYRHPGCLKLTGGICTIFRGIKE